MSIELEAKVKVEEFEPIRARLREAGAKQTERRLERNVYFDFPDKRLKNADEGVRLRTTRPIAGGEETHLVTFKGRQAEKSTSLKSREEIEFTVSDGDAATQLLARLGLQPTLGFEKRREVWDWPGGECEVVLDELVLGKFVEVEGPDEKSIRDVLAALGLAGRPLIKRGYISMLDEERRKSGSSETMFRL
jgi:adenylate cyclase, class 2